MIDTKGVLLLEDGTAYWGRSFGFNGEKAGEVVFNTSLTGYEEILTDPSYCGQIVVMCYPHIGNYGITLHDAESYGVWLEGIIVREYSRTYSNYRAKMSLSSYLKQNKIIGIEGIDTRSLVRKIREKGAMKGIISIREFSLNKLKKKLKSVPSITGQDLVHKVNSSRYSLFKRYKPQKANNLVLVIDYGAKLNIVRSLKNIGLNVCVLSGKSELKDLLKVNPKGVVLSNGPGNPEVVTYGIKLAGDLIKYNNEQYLPVMGICLGHQLLALGAGSKTYKLKFGHHGGNHPVKDIRTNKIEITVQNHNFCVDPETLTKDIETTHINLNDGTVEGLRHKDVPIVSYQYHPEGCPGPHDSEYLFKEFGERVKGKGERVKGKVERGKGMESPIPYTLI